MVNDITKYTLSPAPGDLINILKENKALKRSNQIFYYIGIGFCIIIAGSILYITTNNKTNEPNK